MNKHIKPIGKSKSYSSIQSNLVYAIDNIYCPLCPRCCTCCTYVISVNAHSNFIKLCYSPSPPFLKIWRLKFREVKQSTSGHVRALWLEVYLTSKISSEPLLIQRIKLEWYLLDYLCSLPLVHLLLKNQIRCTMLILRRFLA